MNIRPVSADEWAAWLAMRVELWPEESEAALRAEVEQYFEGSISHLPYVVLVADDGDGRLVGFAEVSVRPHAEGCLTDRVVYLEGWFVADGFRQTGVGGALVGAAEQWGRSQGCSEFASDCDVTNMTSHAAHTALGFEEVGKIYCFSRKLV